MASRLSLSFSRGAGANVPRQSLLSCSGRTLWRLPGAVRRGESGISARRRTEHAHGQTTGEARGLAITSGQQAPLSLSLCLSLSLSLSLSAAEGGEATRGRFIWYGLMGRVLPFCCSVRVAGPPALARFLDAARGRELRVSGRPSTATQRAGQGVDPLRARDRACAPGAGRLPRRARLCRGGASPGSPASPPAAPAPARC